MEKLLEHPWVKEYKEDLHKFRQLDIIEEKTGVDRFYVVTAGLVVLFFGMLGAFGGSPVANLVGFIYPTYRSYKALKSEDKEDDTQWLTYWVVYSFFIVTESFTDILISWIPLYYIAKIGFLYFCMSPTFKGSSIIFKKLIEPFLDQTAKSLDEIEDDVKDVVGSTVKDIQEQVTQKGTEFVVNHVMNKSKESAESGAVSPTSEGSDGDDDTDYLTSTQQDPPTLSDSEDNFHAKSK